MSQKNPVATTKRPATVSPASRKKESGKDNGHDSASLLPDLTALRVSDALAEFEHELDPLTGMAGRRMLEARVTTSLRKDPQGRVALIVMGLTRLPQVRESLGYAAGDAIVRQAAERLRQAMRGSDLIARIGDNDFALLISPLREQGDAAAIATKLYESLDAPLRVEGAEFRLVPAIGVAVSPEDGLAADVLLGHAAAAMQYAVEHSTGTYQFFRPDIGHRISRRLTLEAQLRGALERNEFAVRFQPRVDLATNRLIAAEALVRWRHPQKGELTPSEFLDVAEQTGLIVPIGQTVLRLACAAAAKWPIDIALSVNVSLREFRGSTTLSSVEKTLHQAGFSPGRLHLELNEASLNRAFDEVDAATMASLRQLGVSIALDNFGGVMGNLALLRMLSVDYLKIDGLLIRSAPHERRDASIVAALAALGQRLGVRVIAEGVETAEQLVFARKAGCNEAQGHWVGSPMSAEEFSVWAAQPRTAGAHRRMMPRRP